LIDDGFRAQFPAARALAYLNAGTNGPAPIAAIEAAKAELDRQCAEGRGPEYHARRREHMTALRERYAQLLSCASVDVALTGSTTEGIARVLFGLNLCPGDEVLTSDEEHIGLLGPLQAVRDQRAVEVRAVPLDSIAESVGPRTRLVAVSHVSWISGRIAPPALGALDVPVLLDGAQGLGAVPVDLGALGCAFYAGSAQKWLCGPDGLGVLYVAPSWRERLATGLRSFASYPEPEAGLAAALHDDARRFDTVALSGESLAYGVAAIDVLAQTGWNAVFERGRMLAERLAAALAASGRDVRRRDATTLVGFRSADGPFERARLLERRILVRHIPRTPWLRASLGAWNDDSDLERLLSALA
jgi:L-cysteine/cystine lyase